MSRSLSRNFYLIGVLIVFISFILTTNRTTSVLGSIILLIGGIVAFVAWIGALVKTAQLGRWGWFVCLIVFSIIAMLIYIFSGPQTPKAASQQQASS